LIGPIRQETVSGIASSREIEIVKRRLASIQEFALPSDLFLLAADFYNACRAAGISAGAIDMMICSAAASNSVPVFTADPDFRHYAKHLPITLHKF
jgi:predicted nucleic acid-binding protein